MADLTRERLLECLANMRRAAAAPRPAAVRPPRFIAEMSAREVCEWDVALYELAIRALDAAAPPAGGRVLTCVYCGHAYPQDAPTWGHEVLTAHIRECTEHPMHRVVEQNVALRAALVGLVETDGREDLTKLRAVLASVAAPDEATRAATLAAIDALLATLPTETDRG